MTAAGYIVVGHHEKPPIKLHWTVLFVALATSGGNPGAWLGFLLVVLAHQLGHAVMVYWQGGRVSTVVVQGSGGYCKWQGAMSPPAQVAVAWGGILAQVGLLIITLLWRQLYLPSGPFAEGVVQALVWTNIYILVLNLLPISPLDGHEAWKILLYARSRRVDVMDTPKNVLLRTDTGYVPQAPEELDTPTSSRISDPDLTQRLLNSLIANPYKDTHGG